MNYQDNFFRNILCLFILSAGMNTSVILGAECSVVKGERITLKPKSASEGIPNRLKETEKLNESLLASLTSQKYETSRILVDKLIQTISVNNISDSTLSESYYLIGIYHLVTRVSNEAIHYLNLCISIKDNHNKYDKLYAKALYNLGVAYYSIGDLNKLEHYALKSLEIWKKISGETNPELISSYQSLIIAYTDLKEYEKAISNSSIALNIANSNPGKVSPSTVADLYYSLGVCYIRLADFSKAKIYLDKTESIFINFSLDKNDNYINLMNGLAIVSNALGLTAKSGEYYEKGVTLAISRNSSLAYNIINSYSLFLANDNKALKGEELLRNALVRARAAKEFSSHNYFEVLSNYATYLHEYKIDIKKSIDCFEECIGYLANNSQDVFLKTSVYIGYSQALDDAGETEKALKIIQSLLFAGQIISIKSDDLENPSTETLKPDITSLKILKAKYNILWDIYKKNPEERILKAASNTSELIVSLLDKVRINISEEDSRLILGDRYRVSYLNAIRDFNLLYKKTSDPLYLEKAFEYGEKSKVAGLLTSTRELKAAQFHIPADISSYERELQRKISLYSIRISDELSANKPDENLISNLKENLLESTRKRDSLILVFERKYPDYYSIKYNTQMAGLKDVPAIVGRNGNYINYVVSDTVLYTFVVNRKNRQLLSLHVDSAFFQDIKHFRSLLSMPSPSDNSSEKFKEFQIIGYRLYKALIEPVTSFLISDVLVISPDNILSYLPFETFPASSVIAETNRYKDLSYLMRKFDISYTYSATFMAESEKKEYGRSNKLIAFAPNYPEPIEIQTVLMSRQAENGVLNDLPFARREAEYVSDITGGKLFENSEASESAYKNESGKYDIIHLAMHTLLNDKDPMHSTLIFSHKNDSLEDGYLKTFEIYGIPLKAKMVVLSSCNTGNGIFYSGEGILSLARGFIYSGCQSVIMSMWEIEDRSGTDVVEMFYRNLMKGCSKSVALRKARSTFLKGADQLRSHPYFWSALVIYGNNSPVYYSKSLKVAFGSFCVILLLSIGYYFSKRK
jgi:CHAT domain-containing protein